MISFILVCIIGVLGLIFLVTSDFDFTNNSNNKPSIASKIFGDKYDVDTVINSESNIDNYDLFIIQQYPPTNLEYIERTEFKFSLSTTCNYKSCEDIIYYEWYVNSTLVGSNSTFKYNLFKVGNNILEIRSYGSKHNLLNNKILEVNIVS
jgi:hypothetical protein